jgi:hypothetical protein
VWRVPEEKPAADGERPCAGGLGSCSQVGSVPVTAVI